MVHDYEHKGVTNDFLVATHDDIALVYNDRLGVAVSLAHAGCLGTLYRAEPRDPVPCAHAGARTRTTT